MYMTYINVRNSNTSILLSYICRTSDHAYILHNTISRGSEMAVGENMKTD